MPRLPRPPRASWTSRLYRLLLRSYPSDFREEYGAPMEDAFRAQCDDPHRSRGWRGTLALWRDVIIDTLRVAPRERLSLLTQDVRICTRSLRRAPGFTAIVILTLALAIGSTTAIFTIVNSVLLRPLPYPEPQRLAAFAINFDQPGMSMASFSMADFIDARAQARAFTSMAAYRSTRLVAYDDGGEPTMMPVAIASGQFFDVLAAQPIAGRLFRLDDEGEGRPRVAVISERAWQQRYARDPRVVGRTVRVAGAEHTIVGVARGDLRFPDRDTELWTILTVAPPARRGPYYFNGIARLASGSSIDQAQAQLSAVPLGQRNGADPKQRALKFTIVDLRERIVGNSRPALLLLFAAVACVLLIAVANVANLVLIRGAGRRRDLAIRISLGASRGQLLRHLLVESLLLGLAGCALGLLLTRWGVAVLQSTASAYLPRVDDVRIDGVALAFALATSLVASVGLGVLASMPGRGRTRGGAASAASASDTIAAMADGGRGGTTAATRRMRKAFVIAEICLSFALLVCAGLLSRSLVRLQQTSIGVDADQLLTVRLLLNGPRADTDASTLSFFDDLLTRIRALPGVTSADLSSMIPPEIGGFSENFTIEGQTGEGSPIVSLPIVGPDYFQTMRIKLLRGRAFTKADAPESPRVVIISKTMARQYFANQDPIGKHMKQGGPERPNAPWREIVGVVEDVQYRQVDSPLEAVFYEPHAQVALNGMYLVIRTAMAPERLTSAVREQLRQIDRTLPVQEAVTLNELVSRSVAPARFRTLLVGGFAATAALLALLGIYGVIAYSVLERSREIGIRLALGAPRARIVRHVLAECGLLLATGLGLGLPIAMICANLLARFLFGVTPWDAPTFFRVILTLLGCGLLASLLPARRAARVDPLAMLR